MAASPSRCLLRRLVRRFNLVGFEDVVARPGSFTDGVRQSLEVISRGLERIRIGVMRTTSHPFGAVSRSLCIWHKS